MGIVLLISCMVLVLGSCGGKKTDMTEVADRVEKMVTGNNPLQVKTVSQDKYAYSTLDDATKLVYDEILYAIVHRKKEVQIATTDVEQMELAYLAVRYDYCDLFWLKQFSYVTYSRDDEITAIEITPEYSMTAAEQKKTQKAIDKEADRMLADAPKEGSDYDTTWGNSQYLSRQSEQKESVLSKYVDYNYFGAATADIMQSHTPDSRIPLPECTAVKDNYYVHEGRYITEWNQDVIGALFGTAYNNREEMMQVKFASVDLYEQAMQYFVEEYGIAKYCPGLQSFHYMEDIEGCVLFIVYDY